MNSPDLLSICISAFIAVFVLLSVLAVLMRMTSWIFAHKEVTTDAAVLAAVASAMNTIYPGTIITKVEEVK
ncbi:MAG: hypothetical protein CVT49_01725 [candidate division Zixibacteria bacterium HGW-Zixibacteria-1]|nr:MAG: hypothetical protein CVT49_01725 [candidate division Zixibacteria bacterium HGW-Zixibacteria-1]